jgi:antitoxin (DNA-binding transcriptional repressor) of toxin-antitoxin stability system
MKTVDVQEAQANLTELLSLIMAGTEIILIQDSTPIVPLVSIVPITMPRVAGLHCEAI